MPNTDETELVYGTVREIVLATGPRAEMEKAANALNKRTPQYNHRVREIPVK